MMMMNNNSYYRYRYVFGLGLVFGVRFGEQCLFLGSSVCSLSFYFLLSLLRYRLCYYYYNHFRSSYLFLSIIVYHYAFLSPRCTLTPLTKMCFIRCYFFLKTYLELSLRLYISLLCTYAYIIVVIRTAFAVAVDLVTLV